MSGKLSRLSRAVLAAALGSMVVFGALGSTGAGADLQGFSANSQGFALRVTVDLSGLPAAAKGQIDGAYATARAALPADVQAKLPATFPYKIDEYFVKSASDASSSATKAMSVLTEGNLRSDPALVAEKAGETQSSTIQSAVIPEDSSLAVLTAAAGVLKSTVASGPKVEGNATLASVNATLENVASLLPNELKQAVTDLFATVNSTAATAESSLQTTINTVETTLIGALPTDVKSTLPPVAQTDLSSLIDIPTVPNPLATNLASISELVNKTTSLRDGDKASADAVSTVKSMTVLGGFISVSAINLAAHSEAAGVPGSAKNTAACSIADVRVGGNTGVSLDGKTVFVNVAGNPVGIPVVGDVVPQLKAQVDSVLSQAGLSVKLCDQDVHGASADGTSANQQVSGFVIEFAPKAPAAVPALGINAGDTLMKITIDPTVQTAAQAQPAVVTAPTQALPHTGASATGTAIFGIILIGGAYVLRRRFA